MANMILATSAQVAAAVTWLIVLQASGDLAFTKNACTGQQGLLEQVPLRRQRNRPYPLTCKYVAMIHNPVGAAANHLPCLRAQRAVLVLVLLLLAAGQVWAGADDVADAPNGQVLHLRHSR